MKNVKYSITRFTKKGSFRFTGYGEIDEENLYTSYTDKCGNKVEHIYEDCIRCLHKVANTDNQFKGSYSEYQEIEFENNKGYITELEIEVCYHIWIRILD